MVLFTSFISTNRSSKLKFAFHHLAFGMSIYWWRVFSFFWNGRCRYFFLFYFYLNKILLAGWTFFNLLFFVFFFFLLFEKSYRFNEFDSWCTFAPRNSNSLIFQLVSNVCLSFPATKITNGKEEKIKTAWLLLLSIHSISVSRLGEKAAGPINETCFQIQLKVCKDKTPHSHGTVEHSEHM